MTVMIKCVSRVDVPISAGSDDLISSSSSTAAAIDVARPLTNTGQAEPNPVINFAPNVTVVLANKQDTLSADEHYYSYNSCLDVSKLFTACSPMAK